MKILTYKVMGYTGVYNPENKEVDQIECLATVVVECPTQAILEEKEKIAKREAYNGEYAIEDDGAEEILEPTELDKLDARLTYVEMMSGLLEV
jgi:hypothetical protein